MIEYVLAFAFDDFYKKIVLIEKNKPKWQKGLLNGVGGKIEWGKDKHIHDAVVREFFEETGAETNSDDWHKFSTISYKDKSIIHCYFISNSNIISSVKTTTEEKIFVHDVSDINKLPIINNLSWLIPQAIDFAKNKYDNVYSYGTVVIGNT